MSREPIELLERDAEAARTDAKASFKFRRGRRKAARTHITYAKFLRDLLKGTFLSVDDLRHGSEIWVKNLRCWELFRGLGLRLIVLHNQCSIGRRTYDLWEFHLGVSQVVYRMLDLTRFISLSLSVGPRNVEKPRSATIR